MELLAQVGLAPTSDIKQKEAFGRKELAKAMRKTAKGDIESPLREVLLDQPVTESISVINAAPFTDEERLNTIKEGLEGNSEVVSEGENSQKRDTLASAMRKTAIGDITSPSREVPCVTLEPNNIHPINKHADTYAMPIWTKTTQNKHTLNL